MLVPPVMVRRFHFFYAKEEERKKESIGQRKALHYRVRYRFDILSVQQQLNGKGLFSPLSFPPSLPHDLLEE